MKKKVVLFFPVLEPGKPYHWFPLALLSISAPLVAAGYECVIIDERITPDYREMLLRETRDAVCLGISSLTGFQLYGALHAAQMVREEHSGCKIVWGGPHVSNLPEQSLGSPYVDYIVIGYGEKPFKNLVMALYEQTSPEGVHGLAYKSATGAIVVNPVEHKDTSELIHPLPYHLVDIHRYINPDTQACIYITSYGCPAACTFCSTKYTMKWVSLLESKIESDLATLMTIYPFKKFVMFDATLFVNEERAQHICSLMSKYNLQWICDGRAAELCKIKDETWRMLAASGLISITMGLESGSPRIIQLMKKGGKHLEVVRKTIEVCSKHRIPVTTGVVFGTPSETIEDLQMTFDIIRELKSLHDGFRISSTFFSPLPGTGLYELLEKKYGYAFPTSLAEWAQWGHRNHYVYNQYVGVPWLGETDILRYEQMYRENMTELSSIVV
jgi:radical SAM superfamily enzyme YgiQ (UPF0313 family)